MALDPTPLPPGSTAATSPPATTTTSTTPQPSVVVTVPPTAAALLLTPALVMSVLALAFSIASFWWIQARHGRLISFAPQSFAGALRTKPVLNVPLVLHNTGAVPLIVRNFRLRLDSPSSTGPNSAFPMNMSWSARQGQLEPAGELRGVAHGTRSMPAPFPVGPRSAESTFIEFQTRQNSLDLRAGPLTARVDVRVEGRSWWDRLRTKSDRDGWSTLLSFGLNTQLAGSEDSSAYITRTNDPLWAG